MSDQLEQWEARLWDALDAVDQELENRFGDRFPLHPKRPERGEAANSRYDGLFEVGAQFSPGYGSEHGAGYLVRIRVSTLADVPDQFRKEVQKAAFDLLRSEVPKAFPGRSLEVVRDGDQVKILGDLHLGKSSD